MFELEGLIRSGMSDGEGHCRELGLMFGISRLTKFHNLKVSKIRVTMLGIQTERVI